MFIFTLNKKIKPTNINCHNGYVTWMSLFCFAFTLQIFSLCALSTMQKAYLIEAETTSIHTYSIVSYAQHMIDTNRCAKEEDKITHMDVEIDGIPVYLTDESTYIQAIYKDQIFYIYYESNRIIDLTIEQQ